MKALVLDEERRLELRDVPEPVADAGQTLVEVRAAGVNYADVLIREGRYPQPPPLPYVPGSEVAGTTADGRRVVGFVRAEGGGYAEKVAVEDDWLFDLPATASFEQGAAFVLAYLTAWIPLTRQVVLRPGARVLVTAAAGGVGSAGVQLAASLGATSSAPSARRRSATTCSASARQRRFSTTRLVGSSRSTSSSTRSAARCSRRGSSSCGRSGRSSASGSRAVPGRRSTPRGSSAGTPRSRASTSGG